MTKTILLLCAALLGAGCSTPTATGPVGSASKTVSTLSGQAGVIGSGNGTGTGATYWFPAGMVVVSGNMYIADSGNSTIRQMNLTSSPVGLVDTLAGNLGGLYGLVDSPTGPGTNAAFFNPMGICYDGSANLYVADTANSAVRKIVVATGAVTTVSTQFYWPQDITFISPTLYVVDSGYNQVFQMNTTGTSVSVLAGSGAKGDVDGSGTGVQFDWPQGITNDGANLYVADTLNSTIRQIAAGAVTTLAGQGLVAGSADGAGNVAQFNHPMKLFWAANALYVADTYNQTIRVVQTVP